ncbi:PREDICTED: F-box/kelch-repeat protein At3g13680-like [Camelina sativa]|uniref:F-box/kelch-repeat protein At3g13680-like n=1 Tax=Camelina sativa TaxID=90675 RepID=A0ABM0WAH3_CAMSA|nr:PREDICTED: F-box/kelch-repeat protein At3g13680-like [Camelina sativa]
MTRMSHLPRDLVEEILSRVPMTSLMAIRSTCKEWNALSKSRIFGKKAARKQYFLGFIMMDYRVCSLKFDFQNLVDPLSIKKVGGILNQVEITKVFHCDGLLLCVTKDNSRLVVWNPYLGQTRWIQPRINFHSLDRYALGYDKNRNHKILRLFRDTDSRSQVLCYEVYNFSSNSWKVFYDTADWDIELRQHGVSLKGNTYFLAENKIRGARMEEIQILLPFDFTMEKFGPPLPLPFPSFVSGRFKSISCVRDEQLAALHLNWRKYPRPTVEIWVTNQISLGSVSWSMFMSPTSSCGAVSNLAGSFFIDEEKKVAVFFGQDNKFQLTKTRCNQTANIIGQDGYFKSVNIGEAPKIIQRNIFGDIDSIIYCHPLVCSSSYVPSLVDLQINQPQPQVIRKDIDSYHLNL